MKIVFSQALTAHYDEVKEDTQFARILEERSWNNKIVAYIVLSEVIDPRHSIYATWDTAPMGAQEVHESRYARIRVIRKPEDQESFGDYFRATSEALEQAKRLCLWLVDMDYESEEEQSEDSEYYAPELFKQKAQH